MMIEQTEDWLLQVSECQRLVLQYESLASQIARLLLANGGVTRNFSDEDFALYRGLASRRDFVCHLIQVYQHRLSSE